MKKKIKREKKEHKRTRQHNIEKEDERRKKNSHQLLYFHRHWNWVFVPYRALLSSTPFEIVLCIWFSMYSMCVCVCAVWARSCYALVPLFTSSHFFDVFIIRFSFGFVFATYIRIYVIYILYLGFMKSSSEGKKTVGIFGFFSFSLHSFFFFLLVWIFACV